MRSGGVSRVAEKLGGGTWCRVCVKWTVGDQAEVGDKQKRAEAAATPNPQPLTTKRDPPTTQTAGFRGYPLFPSV